MRGGEKSLRSHNTKRNCISCGLSMCVCSLYMYGYFACRVCAVPTEAVLDSLGLELQMVVSHPVGAGN